MGANNGDETGEGRDEPWYDRPLAIAVADRARTLPTQLAVPIGAVRRPASVLAIVLPVVMMVVGLSTALACAALAEKPSTEGIGTFGVEAGAALWFAGAVTLGGRRSPTVLRGVLLGLTTIVGVALVAASLLLGWSGAALGLAMEFGVGCIAVAVIDVIIIGVVYSTLDAASRAGRDDVVTVRLWPPSVSR